MSWTPEKADITRLSKSGKTIKLHADEAHLSHLGENTMVDAVLELEGVVKLKPWKMNGASLVGSFRTKVLQTCVSTLEPIEIAYEIDVDRRFLPASDPCFKSEPIIEGELVIDPEEDDLPDILEGKVVDIWAVILEEMNLHIDPYPRSTEFHWAEEVEETPTSDTHKPFAELKTLITEKKQGKE